MEALKKLLIGFPSIDIPNDSNLYFWHLNGNNFGTENPLNGRFNKESFSKTVENYSIDGGPLILVHENMKDVVIISPISTRTFQKYGSRWGFQLYTDGIHSIKVNANNSQFTGP